MSGLENTAAPRLPWLVRGVEIGLGALFLLAAGLKLQDPNLFIIQIHGYKIFTNPNVLGWIAVSTLLVETTLGLAMVLGVRMKGAIPAIVLAMLLFFTVLIAYAWPEDCGCFGKVKMGPGVSIAKNVAMMLGAAFVLIGARRALPEPRLAFPRLLMALAAGIAAAAQAYPQVFQESTKSAPAQLEAAAPAPKSDAVPVPQGTPSTAPIAPAAPTSRVEPAGERVYAGYVVESEFGERFDLSTGDYLVASLSMTCEHCMASVPTLNELALNPKLPKMVAIGYEPEPGSMVEFVATTQPNFPIHNIGNNFLEFSRLISDSPPRLALIHDGAPLMHWDKELPPAEEITGAVGIALAP